MSKILKIKDAKKIAVLGDIHSDLESLNKGYNLVKNENIDYIILLGDYADRGEHGPEVIEFIQEKQKENTKIIALKGNHEDYELTKFGLFPNFSPCKLIYQYGNKLNDPKFTQELYNWFESLSVAAIVPNKYFFVHGGISSKVDLEKLDNETIEDLLWSDPMEWKGEEPSFRGSSGVRFGPDITNNFKKKFNIKTIIRSHEPTRACNGYIIDHNGNVLTISSTRAYDGKAAVLIIDNKKPAMDAYQLSKEIKILT